MTTMTSTVNDQRSPSPLAKPHRVCPWWVCYFFDNPLRRIKHPPEKILGPYVSEGMKVLDFGCGFGHFSIGMARMVGVTGQVIAADIQQKVLDKTMARAARQGVERRITPLLCRQGSGIGTPLELDFILACNSMHETPDIKMQLREMRSLLRPGRRLLLMEPAGHLKPHEFEGEVALALEAGFVEIERPHITKEMAVLLEKPQES